MRKRHTFLLSLVAVLAGCNVGNAPEGMTADDAKKAFDSQPIDVKIKQIEGSPMSQAAKDKRIAEIKAGK